MPNFNPLNPTKHRGTNKYITFFVSRNRQPLLADYRQPETGTLYSVGTVWQVAKNPTTGIEGEMYMLTKIVANQGYWVLLAGGGIAGPLLTLSDSVGTVVVPTLGGNIQLGGTSNQIVVTSSPGTNSLSFSLANGVPVSSVMVDSAFPTGVNPVVPTSAGLMTVHGVTIFNNSIPLAVVTRAINTYNVEIQLAAANATSLAVKSGLAHFNSTMFTVDANGFVGAIGGPVHTVAIGTGTTTAVTYTATGTAGQILQSGGAGADPAYSTATYPATAGTANNVLMSNGTNIISTHVVSILGVARASSTTATATTADCSNVTIPTTANTDDVISVTYTPTNASSILEFEFDCAYVSTSTSLFAIFQGTTFVQAFPGDTNSGGQTIHFKFSMTAGTTSATTYHIRSATTGGTTLFLLQTTGSAALYGAVGNTSIQFNVKELNA